ncbi:hypothetical protein [Persicobacter sp. CCB-QB2]|uniref:hypothetical protein n=1 Tax=Persicobacter sp. CCB-QB2 TaxID=1561025 RepID=UPI0006A97E4C|nr:hypothetical protein [Persicobacter sp. CCB-QB2]
MIHSVNFSELKSPLPKAAINRWQSQIEENPETISHILTFLSTGDDREKSNAAWISRGFFDNNPQTLPQYLPELISILVKTQHIPVERNILGIFQSLNAFPEVLHEDLLNVCLSILEKRNYPTANKIFAMTCLANIIPIYPELASEVIILIEDQWDYGTAGFQNRANKILPRLKSLQKNQFQ